MAKNRRNKNNDKGMHSRFPAASDPGAALGWWKEAIRSGLPSQGAAANLHELAAAAREPELKHVLQVLERTIGELMLPVQISLSGGPRAAGHVTLAPDRSLVFVSSATGGITCYRAKDGSPRWSVPAERAFQVGGMAADSSTLYYTDSWNGRLYAVSARDGAGLWCAESASDGSPMLSPAGIALVERAGRTSLLVCDSSSHRLCAFSASGKPQGETGTRGLVSEETAHLNTAPAGAEIPPYFEYPRAVVTGPDCDGSPAVFVWDSGNCRVAVLDNSMNRKRSIPLVPEREIKSRLAGQVRVAFGQSGPVVLVVDDSTRTLTVRGAHGELLLTIDLGQLCASNRQLEIFRIETGGSGQKLLLVSANGRSYTLDEILLDTLNLARALLGVFPDDCNLLLAGTPAQSNAGAWSDLSPSLDPAALVRCLCGGEKSWGELTAAHWRLQRFAAALKNGPLAESASAVRQALSSQLEEIRSACLTTLERLAAPSPRDLESWADALCEVDMEVFQTRGRSSSAELTMDAQLEQVREIRPSIRRCGWKLREVESLLLTAAGEDRKQKYSTEMLELLARLLDRRLAALSAVAGRLEYERDPQQISRQELLTAHAARLQVSAIEGAAAELVSGLARLQAAGGQLDNQLLQNCLEKTSSLECHTALAGLAGNLEEQKVSLPDSPEINGSAGETLTALVDRMGDYLSQVKGGENGPMFSKVLERQKNLFSVKVSVLANYYKLNGRGTEVLEKARLLAGDSWEANRNLRPAVASLEAGS